MANYGCTKYALEADGTEDRIDGCLDKDATGKFIPYMYWAKKMGRTNKYSVRTGKLLLLLLLVKS